MFRAIRKFFGLLHRLRALKRYVTIDNLVLAGLALHPSGHCFLWRAGAGASVILGGEITWYKDRSLESQVTELRELNIFQISSMFPVFWWTNINIDFVKIIHHNYTSGQRYGITHTLAAWVHI